MTDWAVFMRDRDRHLVGQVDGVDRLTIVQRFNRPGSWLIEGLAFDGPHASLLQPGTGLVIDRDGERFLSGPVRHLRRYRQTDQNGTTVNARDYGGPDDLGLLWDRICHPAFFNGNFGAQAYDDRTGQNAEFAMRNYTEDNAGPSAPLTDRRIPGLKPNPVFHDFSDPISARARLDVLGEVVASIAAQSQNAYGVTVLQAVDDRDLDMIVYTPVDRTAEVVISDGVGNLGDFSYVLEVPERNYVYVGGGGEGTARTFVEGGDSASISRWGRIEAFRDRRDTTGVDILAHTRDEELVIGGEKTQLDVDGQNLAHLSFGVDYGLGDRITVVVDGAPLTQIIREVQITVTPAGTTVVPVLGSLNAAGTTDVILDIYDRLRRLSTRSSSLERI